MKAEITARTLEFAVSDVQPIKYDYVYCDVIGVRATYTGEEVTGVTVLAVDQETKSLVPIAYRLDCHKMWEQWLRDLIEDHRVLEAAVREEVAAEAEVKPSASHVLWCVEQSLGDEAAQHLIDLNSDLKGIR